QDIFSTEIRPKLAQCCLIFILSARGDAFRIRSFHMAFVRTPSVQKPARKTFADRYMIVPCETESDLAVIWDRQEEQVVDVISASTSRYTNEDALWDEFHTPPFNARSDWRAAA